MEVLEADEVVLLENTVGLGSSNPDTTPHEILFGQCIALLERFNYVARYKKLKPHFLDLAIGKPVVYLVDMFTQASLLKDRVFVRSGNGTLGTLWEQRACRLSQWRPNHLTSQQRLDVHQGYLLFQKFLRDLNVKRVGSDDLESPALSEDGDEDDNE
jgi:hypothetical protein